MSREGYGEGDQVIWEGSRWAMLGANSWTRPKFESMQACIHPYMHMYLCTYMYVYVFVHVCVRVFMYMCTCVYVFMCLCTCVYVCLYICVCVCTCGMCTCVFTCVCICICTRARRTELYYTEAVIPYEWALSSVAIIPVAF